MQQKQSTSPAAAKAIRSRNFLLMLPVLVFPFFTFLLWSMGCLGADAGPVQVVLDKGFNLNLPIAVAGKDTAWNKSKYYEQADKDSARMRFLLKNDPYYHSALAPIVTTRDTSLQLLEDKFKTGAVVYSYDPHPARNGSYKDPNEEKVYRKLAQLDAELNKSAVPAARAAEALPPVSTTPTVASEDIDRLETMMRQMQEPQGDTEMQQLNGMLEKLLDIQYPERVQEKYKQQVAQQKADVFSVQTDRGQPATERLGKLPQRDTSGTATTIHKLNQRRFRFQSLDDAPAGSGLSNVIRAIIPETQTLVTGSTVKLELREAITINGVRIPPGHLISGVAALSGERLKISIKSIRYLNNILPVSLVVYDTDGQEGMYMPGAITRDVAKQSSDQAVQGMNIGTLDPSLGAQAASAGIEAAKTLIGKKAKLIQVIAPVGYLVLLKDN